MSPSSDWNQLHSRWWTRMIALVLGQVQHLERRQLGRLLALAHVGPDEARALDHLVGLGLDAVLEVLRRRHVRHVEAVAFDVELPAVIDAAQAAFLVAAEEQRGAAVRAAMLHDADPAVGVAEGDELLAEQQEPHRLAVGLQFRRETGGNPVFAHQVAHRRARAQYASASRWRLQSAWFPPIRTYSVLSYDSSIDGPKATRRDPRLPSRDARG